MKFILDEFLIIKADGTRHSISDIDNITLSKLKNVTDGDMIVKGDDEESILLRWNGDVEEWQPLS